MTLAVSSLTGTPGVGPWSGGLAMTFTNFSTAGESLSGDVAFNLSTSNGIDITDTMSGSSLTYTNSANKVSTIRGYNFTIGYNKNTNAYTVNVSGTTSRSDLGGYVSFSTSSPILGNFNNTPDNPTSGTLLVSGINNSKLRLTALSNTNVQLEVDNGSGTFGTPSTTTWATISAL
jgi:hypothetical protein